jgi:adenosylmethionine-8-amino-7-oxononanoate aminotransferase
MALIDKLIDDWLPVGHHHAFFACGGSEGNDSAIRLARLYHLSTGQPGRWKVIGRAPSYHGATLATLAAGAHGGRRSGMEPLMAEWPKATWNDASALAACIESAGPETVSAFIAEPLIGAAGGALVAEADYWAECVEVCKRYGVLMIVDEVMTGFGRTGHKWGYLGDGWEPDILVSGKGLAGGYQPISLVSAADHVVDPVTEAGRNLMFFTYSGHDAACAASLAVLGIFERENLVARSATMGALLRRELDSALAGHRNVTTIRGRGLMQGVGLRPGVSAGRIVSECMARDLWVYPAGCGHAVGDALLLGPPLVVEPAHIDQMVGVILQALDAVG